MATVKAGPQRRRSQPRRNEQGDDSRDLAARLVDEAGRILSTDGAAALTLRRLAAATGTSTMAVYTQFGDKQGLLAAMYRAGFARLGAASVQATAGIDDALTALAELGLAYRRTALANPHLYDLMFGRPIPTFAPDAESEAVADAAYRPLVDAVRRCLDTGAMVAAGGVGEPAERIAFHLWSCSHGMVSLELAGHLGLTAAQHEQAYADGLALAAAPFLPPGSAG